MQRVSFQTVKSENMSTDKKVCSPSRVSGLGRCPSTCHSGSWDLIWNSLQFLQEASKPKVKVNSPLSVLIRLQSIPENWSTLDLTLRDQVSESFQQMHLSKLIFQPEISAFPKLFPHHGPLPGNRNNQYIKKVWLILGPSPSPRSIKKLQHSLKLCP